MGLVRGGLIGRKHFLDGAYLRKERLLEGNTFWMGLIRGKAYWKETLFGWCLFEGGGFIGSKHFLGGACSREGLLERNTF